MVGDLDRRVEIGSFTTTKNLSGEDVRTWTYSSSIWAQVKEFSGNESYEADQKVGSADAEFIIRYRAGITQVQVIKYNSELYDIVRVNEIERKKYLKITAKKQDNE